MEGEKGRNGMGQVNESSGRAMQRGMVEGRVDKHLREVRRAGQERKGGVKWKGSLISVFYAWDS